IRGQAVPLRWAWGPSLIFAADPRGPAPPHPPRAPALLRRHRRLDLSPPAGHGVHRLNHRRYRRPVCPIMPRPMAAPLLATHNMPEFTVSEISAAVKRPLEGTFERVRVRGEVSKPNYHGSGHLYFSLKDENAVIDACAWNSTVRRLKLRLEHGMEVVVTGRVSSYPGSSQY